MGRSSRPQSLCSAVWTARAKALYHRQLKGGTASSRWRPPAHAAYQAAAAPTNSEAAVQKPKITALRRALCTAVVAAVIRYREARRRCRPQPSVQDMPDPQPKFLAGPWRQAGCAQPPRGCSSRRPPADVARRGTTYPTHRRSRIHQSSQWERSPARLLWTRPRPPTLQDKTADHCCNRPGQLAVHPVTELDHVAVCSRMPPFAKTPCHISAKSKAHKRCQQKIDPGGDRQGRRGISPSRRGR